MMSKLFSFLLVLCAGRLAAQPIATADFDSGLTPGWTVVDGGTTPDTWYVTTGGAFAGNTLNGTNFAFVNSDAAGNSTAIILSEQLRSPAFNGNAYSQVFLEFDHFYRDFSLDTGWVEVYNGSTWIPLANYSANTGAWTRVMSSAGLERRSDTKPGAHTIADICAAAARASSAESAPLGHAMSDATMWSRTRDSTAALPSPPRIVSNTATFIARSCAMVASFAPAARESSSDCERMSAWPGTAGPASITTAAICGLAPMAAARSAPSLCPRTARRPGATSGCRESQSTACAVSTTRSSCVI